MHHALLLLLAVLVLAAGCRSDCARLCEQQARCEGEARQRAGLGDLTKECTASCEAMAATEIGKKGVAASVACVQEDCTAMARCLAAAGAPR